MFATTRSAIGRTSRVAIVALPFAVVACGGDRNTATLSTAEAKSTVPVAPAARLTTVTNGGTPISPSETYETGDAAFKAGKYHDAAEMYKVRVTAKPADASGFYMLGLSSWKAGDFSGAKDAFDKSIELNPKFAKSYFNEARVLLDMKRAPEALELIEKGRGVDSASVDGVRLRARAQSESGDMDGAMHTYRDLLVRDDADTWGLNNLGVLLLDRGEFTDALGPLARVVQVKPTAPLFQNNFGMALERSGYKVAALRHYEEAVRNDSTFTKAVKNAERLRGVVTDTTATEEVSVNTLAEGFRQKVKAWKDSVVKVEVKPVAPR
ncbi:MAG: tetratricopeptide repeat protein [Gemmatimonadales bacterium]